MSSEPLGDSNKLRAAQAARDLHGQARLLARYAIETGQFPRSVDVGRLYEITCKLDEDNQIDKEDVRALVRIYQVLERKLGPITASSLQATERPEQSTENGKHRPRSFAGTYVSNLMGQAIAIVVLIIVVNLTIHYAGLAVGGGEIVKFLLQDLLGIIAAYLVPFLYGALGATAFVLKDTTQKLHNRVFDERRVPENRSRVFLGTLAGGVIVLFVEPGDIQAIAPVPIPAAALGFLAGYSTDFLFGTIERVLGALMPRTEKTSETSGLRSELDELADQVEALDAGRPGSQETSTVPELEGPSDR